MRRTILWISLLTLLATTGCMISAQEGEREHVNSPAPEEITFHFDTQFNKVLLFGRSLALLLVPLWAFSQRKGAGAAVPMVLGAVALVASGWLLWAGWAKTSSYRIDVRKDQLRLNIPSEPPARIEWASIEEVYGEGEALDVSLGVGEAGLKWSPQWEDMRISLSNGMHHDVDLRPLSVEQRGTLMRAIGSKAGLQGGVTIVPER